MSLYFVFSIKTLYFEKEAKELDIAFKFIGGIALFIYGMGGLSDGLQKAAGSKMKNILGALTKSKFTSVATGTVVTGIIQSSSATTVMVVGFVNASLMNLTQATGVIMGANIGTTVTAWIVSSVEWAKYLSPTMMAPIILAIGLIASFMKPPKIKVTGDIMLGFGMLFLGLDLMSNSVEPLRSLPLFTELFTTLGHNPVLAILAGAAVTCIIQSSSASVAILQSLALTGAIPFSAAVYIIMGQNIGTCITALLSSIGTSRMAKCAAYIHLLFNVIGTVIFSALAITFFKFINPQFGAEIVTLTDISVVHTAFNIATVLLFYPKPDILITLAKKMAKVDDETITDNQVVHLDERMLLNPSIALASVKTEVVKMGQIAFATLSEATDALINKDREKCEDVFAKEGIIDLYEAEITEYVIKLNKANRNEANEKELTSILQIVSDLERIGDHCENIAESANMLLDDSATFSETGLKEITEMFRHTVSCLAHALKTYELNDLEAADKVIFEENYIDRLEIELRNSHIKRLALDECNPKIGVVFLDTVTNLERISDHSRNIAEEILEASGKKAAKNTATK